MEHKGVIKATPKILDMNIKYDDDNHLSNHKSKVLSSKGASCSHLDTSNDNLHCHSQETELKSYDDDENGNAKVSDDIDGRDLSNDFANNFIIDKEIELEQKEIKNTDFSPAKRY